MMCCVPNKQLLDAYLALLAKRKRHLRVSNGLMLLGYKVLSPSGRTPIAGTYVRAGWQPDAKLPGANGMRFRGTIFLLRRREHGHGPTGMRLWSLRGGV